ncbi:hypothetical protein AWB98_02265 [Mycolicibacterium conceptionense]|uniref:Uncharacterized protein n=1 Tax=Mycolicibacterium conceptionense TaxID=451644 RepID=A0ABX3UZY6_9MYCO|nr:hypothetical protein AWB98_02265 [Mycolicibacterium conceptionense]
MGNYSTRPVQIQGKAITRELGAVIEGQRLANFVVGPWEVDPALRVPSNHPNPVNPTGTSPSFALVLKNGAAADTVLPVRATGAASRHNFVAGFYSSRTDGVRAEDTRLALNNAVLEFPSSAAAAAAAKEITNLSDTDTTLSHGLSIPDHPDTSTFQPVLTDDCSCGTTPGNYMMAFTSRGPYVLVQLAWALDNPDSAAGLIAKALDLQVPLVDKHHPTPLEKLADLPVDPTGLLSLTVPISAAASSPNLRSAYDVHGALHFQHDPIRSGNTFQNAGLIQQGIAAASVYETHDHHGAEIIVDSFYNEALESGTPTASPKGLPKSRCLSMAGGSDELIYCVMAVAKYAIEVSGPQTDTQQRLAAQYQLLEHPK